MTATATDIAGNIGSAGTYVAVLDNTPPAVTEQLGTNTSNPLLTGGGDANATVTLTLDGTILGTTVANAAGVWSFSPALSAGSYTIVASETDIAGNTGTASVSFTLATAVQVTVTGSGTNTYVPQSGANTITLGTGNNNTVTLGNGNDAVGGTGSGDIVIGGSGNDGVFSIFHRARPQAASSATLPGVTGRSVTNRISA